MEDIKWERFTPPRRLTRLDEPGVSIHKRGTIGFNRAAYKALGEPEAVHFLYSRKAHAIAFEAASRDDASAYPIMGVKRRVYHVSAIAFLKYNGIPFGESRRYLAKMEGDRLVILLDQREAT